MSLLGIHHVTAICSDAQKNVDFYADLLGLHVVKVTVNFDDPNSYHLYYADATGSPGTLMTFFVWPGGRRGRVGPSQVTATAFAIPLESLDFWQKRLLDRGIACETRGERFGEPFLRVQDPDGMPIELIGVNNLLPVPATSPIVPQEHAIRMFHSVTITEFDLARLEPTLLNLMQLKLFDEADGVRRFAIDGGGVSKFVDARAGANERAGHMGAGVVHHVAFRVANDQDEVALQNRLQDAGLGVSPVTERNYFRSIYYREPGGVLFEIATDGPGMAIDEPAGQLGTTLRLPQWYEAHRQTIIAGLPRFKVPGTGIQFPTPAAG